MSQAESHETLGSNGAKLRDYLLRHDDIFRELHARREDGHNNPKADAHFAQQRSRADKATERAKLSLYNMMQSIGAELNSATHVLEIKPSSTDSPPMVLDLCMAPGGFSAAALKINPTAKLRGITLPPDQGGHDVFLPVDGDKVQVEYLDITLLAGEMGVSADSIPPAHPDAAKFLQDAPFSDVEFDLVFCDGQVLRTHESHRASYREKVEATRLLTSQLVLALRRVRDGGTLVVLLHRVDKWATARLLYGMSRVGDVRLFKPRVVWGKRGSFYMIVENVRPRCPAAEDAVRRFKMAWRMATFDADGVNGVGGDGEEGGDRLAVVGVDELLAEFGERLVTMGRAVWKIQADALRKASWNIK